MKRTRIGLIVLAAVAIMSAGILIRGVVPLQLPPTGTWAPTPSPMAVARAGAASSLLTDGRVLVTGGSNSGGALSSAEFMNADGSFTAAPSMQFGRSGHTSTVLGDGRVLVAGGTGASGTPTDTAEIFDPIAGAWSSAPSLMVPRSGHTATVLADGRILIAGGVSSGAPTASLEIWDMASGAFTSAPSSLSTPRQNHAAALLSDGRVLIVGGSDGTNTLASSDIFDPSNDAVSAGPAMGVARSGLSATTLLDGSVLVAGGITTVSAGIPPVPTQQETASAEIMDAAATSFTAISSLGTARSGHLAFLLPHNYAVLIVGGTSNGTALNSSELYVPWLGTFSATGSMSSPRSGASGAALSQDGGLLVAGGIDTTGAALSTSEVYGFATIKTDKADYPPGTVVNISGSGWQPNETVQMSLVEVPDVDADSPILINTTADANGKISDSSFSTNIGDVNIKITLTAVGAVSQAQTTFTDANSHIKTFLTGCTTAASTFNFGDPVCAMASGLGGGDTFEIKWFDESSTLQRTSPHFTNNTGSPNYTYTPISTGTWTVQLFDVTSNIAADSTAITVNTAHTTTTSVSCAPSSDPVNAPTTCTATVADVAPSGATTPTGSVTFTHTGSGSFSSTTCALSSGSCSVTYTPSAVGTGTHTITGSYGGDTTHASSTSTAINVTVTSTVATATTITSSANPSTYGQSVSFTATVSPNSGSTPPTGSIQFVVDGTSLGSPVALSASGSNGVATSQAISTLDVAHSPHTVMAKYTPTGVFTGTGGSLAGGQSVGAKTLTTSIINNPTKPYDGNSNATLTSTNFSLSGLVGSDSFTVTQTAGTYNSASVTGATTVTASLSAGNFTANGTTMESNYNLPSTASGMGTITAVAATWTTNPNSKTYGDADPSPLTTGSGSNFIGSDGVSATYSRAPGETVSGGPYHITATLSATVVGALDNYIITNAGASFTINARLATWTTNPNSKTYGDSDPNPLTTGSGSNFVAADNVTATYSRVAGENASSPTYHITAALSATGLLSNYNITNAGAEFTINKRDATWTTNPNSKTYGDADPNPLTTGSGSNFVAGDNLTAAYSRVAGEAVLGGPYHITATLTPAAALSNYIITNAGASFTINPKLASATPDAKTKIYGASDPTLTGTLSGFLASDGVTATYTRTAGETVAGSPYTISATLSPAAVLSNYSITYNTASFTITPANTTTAVTLSMPNPSVYDQPITLSALVVNASNSAGVNEGMIVFNADGVTPLCTTGGVLGGAASCTTGPLSLNVGSHSITAAYVPGPDFFASGSAPLAQGVTARHTSVTITSTDIANFASSSVAIDTTVHLQVTVTDDDPAGTPITPTGSFSIGDPIASDIFSPADGSGNGLCTLSGSGASASCSLTVVPVEADLHELTANYPGDSLHLASTQKADIMVTAPLMSQKVCLNAPFNGQAIPPGSTVWFNGVFQTTGQKITTLTHLTFYHQTIQIGSNGLMMPVPDGVITFDPSATSASTTFDAVNNRWVTILPTYNLAGKNWLSGMPVQLPSGLAASTSPVTWCGQFASDDAGLNLGWQWAAAVYTKFTAFDSANPSLYDLNTIGVKAVDDNKADINYKNSDHAGTPENYLPFVIGGARGGGGGNYTGGYSGSGNLH